MSLKNALYCRFVMVLPAAVARIAKGMGEDVSASMLVVDPALATRHAEMEVEELG